MNFSLEQIQRASNESGFNSASVEKVVRLLDLLEGIGENPFLSDRFALKGGTALNLFFFEMPRLSVDIDLNYIGAEDRETMLKERALARIEFMNLFEGSGLRLSREPTQHSGGKWVLKYQSLLGRPANLHVDTAFTSRIPLWSVRKLDSRPLSTFTVRDFPVLDIHDLAGGKLSALFSRRVARDLFDAANLFSSGHLDWSKTRLAFVVYVASSRTDLRDISPKTIGGNPKDLQNKLVPLLSRRPSVSRSDAEKWTEDLIAECRGHVSKLLPFKENERIFLDFIHERGEIRSDFLTEDPTLKGRIERQPHLNWKTQNIRKYKGLAH